MSSNTATAKSRAAARPAEIVREYGPFPETKQVHGVSYDGKRMWAATGTKLLAIEPQTGEVTGALEVMCDAGTAFDGKHLYQIAESRIDKIDPATGKVLASIPAPGGGKDSGLAWAEGTLWVGQYRERKIHQIDPETGAILRTIESNRFVTGVTWVDGELWHATWKGAGASCRGADPKAAKGTRRSESPWASTWSGLGPNVAVQFSS